MAKPKSIVDVNRKRPKTGGRSAGTPNKITGDFKAAVTRLLDHGAPYMTEWIDRVATGDVQNGVKPDPGRALDLMGKLADFAAPRLARTELAGDKDAPIKHEFTWVK